MQRLEPLYAVNSILVLLVVTAALLYIYMRSISQDIAYFMYVTTFAVHFLCLYHCSYSSWEPSSVIEHVEEGSRFFSLNVINMQHNVMQYILFDLFLLTPDSANIDLIDFAAVPGIFVHIWSLTTTRVWCSPSIFV